MLIGRKYEMKKRILALVSAAVLVFSMSMTAFATPSSEVGDNIILDQNGNEINSGAIKVENGISDKYKPALRDFDFDKLIADTDLADDEWVLVGEKEVIEVGDADGLYPITVTFDADDFAGEPVIFAFIDGEWTLVELTYDAETGKYLLTLDAETALMIYEKAAVSDEEGATPEGDDDTDTDADVEDNKGESDKENGGSPQTGDTTSFVWVGVALAAAVVVLASRRKRA